MRIIEYNIQDAKFAIDLDKVTAVTEDASGHVLYHTVGHSFVTPYTYETAVGLWKRLPVRVPEESIVGYWLSYGEPSYDHIEVEVPKPKP